MDAHGEGKFTDEGMLHRCLLSFGANLGDPSDSIRQAAELLAGRAARDKSAVKLSRFFRTPPIGGPSGQPPFVNAVAAIETYADAWQMWNTIRDVERELGRERNQRWEARRIDLDILLFDDCRIWTPRLKIPHPRMAMRRFILVPSLDVAAQWRDPVTGMSIQELADNLDRGAASLVLIADPSCELDNLLDQVARQAVASYVVPTIQAIRKPRVAIDKTESCIHPSDRAVDILRIKSQRWVGQISSAVVMNADTDLQLSPHPNLAVFLAAPVAREDVAWEDYHAQVARRMGLMEQPTGSNESRWPVSGPRYLLAGDDPQWAVHEIVAALEAMDCPLEPISIR